MPGEESRDRRWDRILKGAHSLPGKIWRRIAAKIEGPTEALVAVVQFVAATLLIVVILRLLWWAITPPQGIVVLPFENHTGVAEYDAVARGIPESLIAEMRDIGRIHRMKARGPETVRIVRAEKIELPIMGGTGAVDESLKDIGAISTGQINVPVGSLLATIKALISGSGKTMSGSMHKTGSTIRIVARLDEDGQRSKAWEVSGLAEDGPQLTGLIEELALKICWGLSDKVAAQSWESFKHFTYGLENSRLYELTEATEDAYAYKAIRNYEAATNIQPGYALAHYNLGAIYYDLGECTDPERMDKATCERALREFEKATEAAPNFPDAYYDLGVTYDTPFFNREMAIECYSKAIGLDPDYAEAYRSRGSIYLDLQEYDKAIDDFGRLIDLKPNETEGYVLRGSAYRAKADFEQGEADDLLNRAIHDFSRVVDLDFRDAYHILRMAYDTLFFNREKAIESYSKAIGLDPDDSEAYGSRGLIYLERQEYEEAIDDFGRLIDLKPNDTEGYVLRGSTYLIKAFFEYAEGYDRLSRAIDDFSRVVALDPDSARAHYNLGCACTDAERYKDAIHDLSNAIDLESSYAEAHIARGQAYSGNDDQENAIADFTQAIALDPASPEAYKRRATTYRSLGDHSKAVPDLDEAARYFGMAIADLTAALELDPNVSSFYYDRGLSYKALWDVKTDVNKENEEDSNKEYAISYFENMKNAILFFANRAKVIPYIDSKARAILDFKRFLELEEDPLWRVRAGDQIRELHDEETIARLDELIQQNPDNVEAFYRRGQAYAHARVYDKAIANFDRVIELKPKDALAHLEAKAYLQRGIAYAVLDPPQEDKAIADFKRVIAMDETEAEAYRQCGLIYERWAQTHDGAWEFEEANEDYTNAMEDLGRVIEIRPDDVEAYRHRAQDYYNMGLNVARVSDDPHEARKHFRRAISDLTQFILLTTDRTDQVWAFNLRGLSFFEKAGYEKAIFDFNNAIELEEADASLYYNRGNAYYGRAKYREAIEDYNKAIELDPNNAGFYYKRGCAHESVWEETKEGQHREAAIQDLQKAASLGYEVSEEQLRELREGERSIAELDRMIAEDRENDELYYLRGVARAGQGQHELAVEDFDMAIELQPDFIEAFWNRGLAHSHLDQYQQAVDDFARAIELSIELEMEDAELYRDRGQAHLDLGNRRQAIRDFGQVIKLEPTDAQAHFLRGTLYSDLGDYDSAIDDFEKAIEFNPNDIEAQCQLGIAYTKVRDYSQAFIHFDRAIEVDPLDARAYNGLGIAYTNLEDYPQAITYLDRAINLNPAYGEAYYRRGIARKTLGDNRIAIQDFERVLQMSEDPYWQRLAEEQLGELRQE